MSDPSVGDLPVGDPAVSAQPIPPAPDPGITAVAPGIPAIPPSQPLPMPGPTTAVPLVEAAVAEPWGPTVVEPPRPGRLVLLARGVRTRGRRVALIGMAVAGLVAVVGSLVLFFGERARTSQAQSDLARARAELIIVQADRADALRRAQAATDLASRLGDKAEELSDAARALEGAIQEERGFEDAAVKALNDAGAALSAGNVAAVNQAVTRLNDAVGNQQRKAADIRSLLDDFDRRRAELQESRGG